VARDAAGGMGGAPSRTGENDALVISDLVDLGLAVVFAIVARVAAMPEDLLHVDAEFGHGGLRAVRRQQPPAFERPADTWKIGPPPGSRGCGLRSASVARVAQQWSQRNHRAEGSQVAQRPRQRFRSKGDLLRRGREGPCGVVRGCGEAAHRLARCAGARRGVRLDSRQPIPMVRELKNQ
jgi:hypothetical protein